MNKKQNKPSQEPGVGHSFSTDLTTPPPQPTEVEEPNYINCSCDKAIHPDAEDVCPRFMKYHANREVAAQLQALKQALPSAGEKAYYTKHPVLWKPIAPEGNAEHYDAGRNQVLTEVETLIDTYIARIKETK